MTNTARHTSHTHGQDSSSCREAHSIRTIPNFPVDVAARAHNSLGKCFMPDAFAEPWDGRYGYWGWCNPPYSNIEGWVRQSIECTAYGFNTVMLIPSLNGATHDELVLEYAVRIVFIIGRLSFIGADGEPKGGNNRGSIFAQFSPERDRKVEKFKWVRRSNMERWYEQTSEQATVSEDQCTERSVIADLRGVRCKSLPFRAGRL